MGYCIQCGSELPEETKFCMKCGAPVDGEAYASPETQEGTSPIQEVPAPVQEESPVQEAPAPAQGHVTAARKHSSAYKVFYGFAAAFFAVQLVPLLLTFKEELESEISLNRLGILDNFPGTVTAIVISTSIPVFLGVFLIYEVIRLMTLKPDSSDQKRRMGAKGALIMAIALLVIEVVLASFSPRFLSYLYYVNAGTSIGIDFDIIFELSSVGEGAALVFPLSLLATLLLCAGNAMSKKA
ncbi:zinc ribbon domain-containing protein [Bifidobacterium sp. 64T4]|uniref:zinc ribbon domain-containing protein n=1 Tax=Bifidobacterium pongonis TaxID=2834432 RepID=UPI001C583B9A|nr:zinc ribbon domain-containing protein [Bifidobacterium pongonis]MBW3095471.1 zinc ribbon domain-containing protein [Bifidobacterium pongonis]